MSIRTRRVLNALVLGTIAAFVATTLEHYADLTKAVQVRDWHSVTAIATDVGFGVLLALLRATQGYVPAVPSPEPEEN